MFDTGSGKQNIRLLQRCSAAGRLALAVDLIDCGRRSFQLGVDVATTVIRDPQSRLVRPVCRPAALSWLGRATALSTSRRLRDEWYLRPGLEWETSVLKLFGEWREVCSVGIGFRHRHKQLCTTELIKSASALQPTVRNLWRRLSPALLWPAGPETCVLLLLVAENDF